MIADQLGSFSKLTLDGTSHLYKDTGTSHLHKNTGTSRIQKDEIDLTIYD